MKEKKKNPVWRVWIRRGVLTALAITIGMMVCQRVSQTPPSAPAPQPTQTADERTLREIAYDKDVQALEKLLQSGAADADTQQAAARRLERMVKDHQSEAAIEEALHQAGYETALVLLQNDALTVMLSAHTISAEASAAIWSLCTAHADVSPENIRIMPSQN